MTKYHIFDLDGTLVDSIPNWMDVMMSLVKGAGIEIPDDFIDVITPLGYYDTGKYIRDIGVNLTVEEILEKIDNHMVYAYGHVIELKPYVSEYIKKLKADGCKLYVLTASPHSMTDTVLRRWGIFDEFECVWTSDDLGYSKSDERIYHRVAEIIGVTPSDITFYDDNYTAIKTATSTGVHTVAMFDESSSFSREEFESVAEGYAESFKELV